MKPYYILELNNFNTDRTIFDSGNAQICLYNTDEISTFNTDPNTKFTKDKEQNIQDTVKYDLYIETRKKDTIRVYGMNGFLDEYILVNEKKIYHSTVNNILVLSTNQSIFKQFCSDFDGSKLFSFNSVNVDFEQIIKHRKSLGVQSIWWNNIPDDVNVYSVGMFGDMIESTEQYNDLKARGANIKNLSIQYVFNDNLYRIMVSDIGGIILYEHMDSADALPLINDVYDNLFKLNKFQR